MSKVIKLNRNKNLTWEEILNQFILLKQAQGRIVEIAEDTLDQLLNLPDPMRGILFLAKNRMICRFFLCHKEINC